jgi:hypothetical protein
VIDRFTRSRPVSCAAALAATAWLGAAAVQGRELWERDWIEARSENFTFISAISEKRTIELAERLERFRGLIVALTSPERVEPPAPFEIYLFRQPDDEVGLSKGLGGYFLPTRTASLIVLQQHWNMSEWIQHEYAHFLLRNRGARGYPPWLDEGTAELLATVELDGEFFNVGKPPRLSVERLSNSRWLDYADVLDVRDPRELGRWQRALFYNQSWLLLHYLNWGRPSGTYRDDVGEYLRQLNAGVASEAAFTESFGLEIPDLVSTLRYYGRLLPYSRGRLPAPLPETGIELRQMRPDEIAAAIGQITFARGEVTNARHYFETALRLNRNNPDARAGIVRVSSP